MFRRQQMNTQEINNAVTEYDIASKKAAQYMIDNPQQWDNWFERVEFQYYMFKQYLKDIRNEQ